MAGESSTSGPAAPPSLGPTLGSSVRANKAEILRLRTDSDVPWGVVHFYREGEDAPWLDAPEEEVEETEEGGPKSEDYTTLCIPCVPAYMSPGRFLNFLGEKWREHLSHCRLVMTSRPDRYLALLKFRDTEHAEGWREDSEGRQFDTNEVSSLHRRFGLIVLHVHTLIVSLVANVPCNLRKKNYIQNTYTIQQRAGFGKRIFIVPWLSEPVPITNTNARRTAYLSCLFGKNGRNGRGDDDTVLSHIPFHVPAELERGRLPGVQVHECIPSRWI